MKKGKTEAIKYANKTKKESEGNDKGQDTVKSSAALVHNSVPLPKNAGILEV
jgi:hypothetical protein